MSSMMDEPGVEQSVSGDEFTLMVTDLAAGKIRNILQERGVPDYGLRVFVAGGGCSGMQYGMALESQARDFDRIVDAAGVKLFVDPDSADFLHGATIDYEDNLMSGGFRIENPNASSTCRCGQSFRTPGSKGNPSKSSSCGCQ